MVQEISYDDETGEMIVTYNSGKPYVYQDVPEDVARRVANAPSVGQAINSEIKGKYSARRVG
jgi:hypothetical protein